LHDKRPFVQTPDEIAALAAEVRDPNYRIAVAEDGIHVYNRDIHKVGSDAMAFFPDLDVRSDGAHAFYLGAELAKAETAWRLGKRYVQDEPLDWGASADLPEEDTTAFKKAGHTKHSGPGAPPGTRDFRSPEADAVPPETVSETGAEPERAGPDERLVCGRLVPTDEA
ncbi:MAG: dihydropteroate synthase, partial [Parafilimonas terrae]|nr:dihydropteroate synthase [Parafilimonas terrae]